jgi:hypothetical protein
MTQSIVDYMHMATCQRWDLSGAQKNEATGSVQFAAELQDKDHLNQLRGNHEGPRSVLYFNDGKSGRAKTTIVHVQNRTEQNNNAFVLHRQLTWGLLCTPSSAL